MADSANSSSESRVCLVCNKAESEMPNGLKRCARCHTGTYCSKECQTSHWPQHKSSCSQPRPSTTSNGTNNPPHAPLSSFFKQPNLSEAKTYQLLIDSFRLRCDDDYAYGGHHHGIYAQDDPLPVFRDFLTRASAAGMLPTWWSAAKQAECEALALDEDGGFYIHHATEKSDIQEQYTESTMPMTLRMVAENVYGGGYGMGQRPMPQGYRCQCRRVE